MVWTPVGAFMWTQPAQSRLQDHLASEYILRAGTRASIFESAYSGVIRLLSESSESSLHRSYTFAALVDFTVCCGADWFVGWPGSTFARLLGRLRHLDHGQGYFAVCPSAT